jgi:hypothetical protein
LFFRLAENYFPVAERSRSVVVLDFSIKCHIITNPNPNSREHRHALVSRKGLLFRWVIVAVLGFVFR